NCQLFSVHVKQKNSRTKTKKFSDHVLRSYTRQNLRTKKRAR
ncbi:DUF1661 domain-containing protein, partial [Porphyromonas gingivalis]